MSKELFKMNMISSVQKLDNEDIEIIQNYIETIEQENKQLKEKINKAIEYIKYLMPSEVEKLYREEDAFDGLTKKQVAANELLKSMIKSDKLLEILQGIKYEEITLFEKTIEGLNNLILGDKEIEEIPVFEGTLEQLNNLSIIGEKEND